MTALKTAKSLLRKEFKKIILRLDKYEKLRQSEKIFNKLIKLPEYQKSKRISIYLSTPDEIDTLPILKHLLENGKLVFIPRYSKDRMEMVRLTSIEDYHRLPLTKWNIKQPLMYEIREDALETGGLDLIIMPGVAFTKNGKRLGHGMGYYDKYLNQIENNFKIKPLTIALAFNEQVIEDIPTNEYDFIIDKVLTEH